MRKSKKKENNYQYCSYETILLLKLSEAPKSKSSGRHQKSCGIIKPLSLVSSQDKLVQTQHFLAAWWDAFFFLISE